MSKTSLNVLKINFLSLNFLLAVLFLESMNFAQSVSPQSVNSSGTIMSQVNGSLSFTVGELVVLTQVDSAGNSLGSGFTTGATISTASIQEPDVTMLNVKVFPNPTSDLVTIAINDTKLSQIIIEVLDINGKIVSSEKYAGIANNIGINTLSWGNGNYILNLKNNKNQIIGTYKIIKN